MEENKIADEVGRAEVNRWLDELEVSSEKREDVFVARVIDDIVKAVVKGRLLINDDGTITQVLLEPLGDNGVTKEIKYNGRYEIGKWHDKLKKISTGDTIGAMFAKCALLSSFPEALFRKMIKQDWDVASNITVFF